MNLRSILRTTALAASVLLPSALWAKPVTVAVYANLTGLDPANVNDFLSQSSTRLMYQGLFSFDQKMKITPLLAESYEANDDATEFTIKLKSGIKFHDGTDFNAEAVKVNIDRLRDPANNLSRRSLVSMVSDVQVVDDTTVKLILEKPFGAMIASLAHPGAMMISPAALEKHGKEVNRNPVGTGPFKFVSWSADTLEVTKNDDYWKEGLPKVEGVTVKSVPESGARFAMLQTGEAQFVPSFPPELLEAAAKNPKLDVITEDSIFEFYTTMNTTKKPFDDKRVRQAMNYAIDKEAFCKVAFGPGCMPADSIIPPLLSFHAAQTPYPYDPEKAKALLKEAGYENGFETDLWSGSSTEVQRGAQVLQQQLAQVGVKANVMPLESGVATEKIWSVQKPEDATVQMYYTGWSSSTGDADWGIRPLLYSESFPPNLFNVAYYKNDQADAAIKGAIGTAKDEDRAKFYAEAQKIVWDDAPWIFLSVPKNYSAKQKALSGVYIQPDRMFVVEEAEFTE
ncbi:glutathione ABC transporter substrate-binding protein [Paracoccus suum]|uniref:Glutathione-binding protein GsiB n=1 Tax=Paracoccus suum TaxID=2259340 RepID=A0A344PGE3_9RHOB|nr:glutathione ABC transporter substrate-binding protein [Paracoccus suum]AXC48448.1 glutathione ABC transporter substrate-binding protein [Paracoccus suum]